MTPSAAPRRALQSAPLSGILLCLALCLGGTAPLYGAAAPSQQRPSANLVTVPQVVGLPLPAAVFRLLAAGLALEGIDTVAAEAEPGTVVRQVPEAEARVPRGSGVLLTVAAARTEEEQQPPMAVVPDLQGLDLRGARATLRRARLALGEVTERPVASPEPGTVLRQDPAPGREVRPGSAVAVTVAAAPPPPAAVVVPSLVGSPPEQALLVLREARLRAVRVDTVPRVGGDGRVSAQEPTAGTEVPPGSGVALQVAVPAPPPAVVVPELVGRSVPEAVATVHQAGLRVLRVDTLTVAGGTGTIREQSPPPGTPVEAGSGVALVVGVADLVEVPTVVGLPLRSARQRLLERRLRLDPADASLAEGDSVRVAGQSPPAQTRVPAGSRVRVTVEAIASTDVAVPDLLGLSTDEADSVLLRAGLQPGATEPVVSTEFLAGTVIGQTPLPGERVPPHTVVSPLVAAPPPITNGRAEWPAVALAMVAVLGAGILFHRLRRSGQTRGGGTHPPLRLAPRGDAGVQEVRSTQTPFRAPPLRLRVHRGPDEYRLQVHAPSLLSKERP